METYSKMQYKFNYNTNFAIEQILFDISKYEIWE